MSQLINILSTKTLNKDLIKALDPSVFNILSFDFIEINEIPFDKSGLLNESPHWIISSQNTLNILLNTYTFNDLKNIKFYCVGKKTKQIIQNNNLTVITSALSSKTLADEIGKNHYTKTFTFIGGEMRRNELKSVLKNLNIQLNEYLIYSTTLSPNEITTKFDGILFFSPSAIQSFVLKNSLTTQTLFCIGNTTATEAKKHSNNIRISKEQTFESVLNLVNTHYK